MQRLLIIILLNLIFYRKTIGYGYCSDDEDLPKEKPKGRLRGLWHQVRGISYFNSKTEHTINLLIHTAVCSLIYMSFGMTDQSFWGAMFFSVSPASLMGALHLSAKHYALTTALMLLGYKFTLLFPFLYLFTSFLGFNTTLMPTIFYGNDAWIFMLLIPVWIWLKLKILPGKWFDEKLSKNNSSLTMLRMDYKKIIIFFKTLCYYTCFCVFPKCRGMYHDFLYTYGIRKEDNPQWLVLDGWFWGGVAILFTFITNILFNPSPLSFGLLWYLSAILFWCNLLPTIQQPVAERYAYLANVGIMYSLACLVLNIPDIAIRSWILGGLFLGYMVRSYIEIPAFKDNQRWLDYNVSEFNFPRNYFAWTIKGEYELYKLGDWAKGLDSFRNAFLSRKVCARINFRLAFVLGALGRFEEALFHYEIAVNNPMEGKEDLRNDVSIVSLGEQLKIGLEKQRNAIKQAGESNPAKPEGQ